MVAGGAAILASLAAAPGRAEAFAVVAELAELMVAEVDLVTGTWAVAGCVATVPSAVAASEVAGAAKEIPAGVAEKQAVQRAASVVRAVVTRVAEWLVLEARGAVGKTEESVWAARGAVGQTAVAEVAAKAAWAATQEETQARSGANEEANAPVSVLTATDCKVPEAEETGLVAMARAAAARTVAAVGMAWEVSRAEETATEMEAASMAVVAVVALAELVPATAAELAAAAKRRDQTAVPAVVERSSQLYRRGICRRRSERMARRRRLTRLLLRRASRPQRPRTRHSGDASTCLGR